MKKIFLAIIALFCLSSCVVEHEDPVYLPDEEPVQTFPLPPQAVLLDYQVSETEAPAPAVHTPPLTSSKMDEQATKLKKELTTSGIQVRPSNNKILLIIPSSLAFSKNTYTISEKFEPVLVTMAKIIKEYDATRIQIIGYTGNDTSMEKSVQYSLRQANAIANFLRLNGVNLNRIVVDGFGAQNPIATNTTEKGRQQNQRVEISLINMY